jgi:hypothetical protein
VAVAVAAVFAAAAAAAAAGVVGHSSTCRCNRKSSQTLGPLVEGGTAAAAAAEPLPGAHSRCSGEHLGRAGARRRVHRCLTVCVLRVVV